MPLRPMKPATIDWSESFLAKLRYPLLGSPKLDGIRCLTPGGSPQTASGLPFPNRELQELLRACPDLDGELCAGDPFSPNVCNTTQRVVMSESAPLDGLAFYVFDWLHDLQRPFAERVGSATEHAFIWQRPNFVKMLAHTCLETPAQVLAYLDQQLSLGAEGIILRDPAGRYKAGRSTLREGGMLRIKPREDAEAIILEALPLFTNTNDAYTDGLGRTKRSSAKAGKVQLEMLGKLVCRSTRWPLPFEIGTGFTEAQRAALWRTRTELPGKIAKFSYQAYGALERPRQPSFIGFRDPRDLEKLP